MISETRPARPLASADLRLLAEIDAGHVTVLPLAGAAVLAPGGHPTHRRIVTREVGELLFSDYLEIGPGHGRRIPVVLSARGREALALARSVMAS